MTENIDPQKVGETMTYGGAASTAGAWAFSLNELIALAGLAVAIVGVIVQYSFARRRDRREREHHAARMAKLTEDK